MRQPNTILTILLKPLAYCFTLGKLYSPPLQSGCMISSSKKEAAAAVQVADMSNIRVLALLIELHIEQGVSGAERAQYPIK